MTWMSKITGIVNFTDKVLGSRKTAGWIDRIIKVISNRNINRITVFCRALIAGSNIYQDFIYINAADLLVSMT